MPLLDCAHALGGIEEGELSLDVPCGVGFQIQPGEFLGIGLSGPVEEEALVFGDQFVDAGGPQVFDAAQVDGEELCGDFRVGVGVLGVGHKDERGALAAQGGASGDLPALVDTEEHVRCPQADAVADAAVERREALRLIDVLDGDVAFLEAEHAEPVAQGEVGGGHGGDEERLAAHVVRMSVHFRVVFVVALGLEDRAVGAEQEGVGVGFVVGDGDGVRPVAERAHHAGHGAGSGEYPLPCGKGVELGHAGREEEHFDVQPFLFVPPFFFGIPDEEGFVLVKPCGAEFDRGRRECRTGKCDEKDNRKGTRKHFEPPFHKKLLQV